MHNRTVLISLFLIFVHFSHSTDVDAADLILTGSLNGVYNSTENILTSGNCYVAQGATATLSTSKTVILNPGFHVILGGVLSIDNSDTDSDGLPDSWEMSQFGNLNQGLNDDYDGDLITHYWECLLGLSGAIAEFDSDSDGMPDWYEVATYQNLDHDISSGDCDCD